MKNYHLPPLSSDSKLRWESQRTQQGDVAWKKMMVFGQGHSSAGCEKEKPDSGYIVQVKSQDFLTGLMRSVREERDEGDSKVWGWSSGRMTFLPTQQGTWWEESVWLKR